MNILFISRSYYPHIGGVEKHAREIARRLIKRGHKVVVVTQLGPKEKQEELKDGVKIIRFYYPKIKLLGLLRIWLWFINNLQLVKEANVVHIHDVFIWYLPLRFLFPQKPVFVTFHGWEGEFPIPLIYRFIRKISEKLSWGNICVGNYLTKWYGAKPNYVTYGGVNVIKSLKFKFKNSLKRIPKILFIGRLDEDTGLEVYLDALNNLKVRGINFKFEACGNGPLIGEVARYGRVNGFVKNLFPYIAKSHFIFSSGYLSILEAMAAKKIVFAAGSNPLKRDYLKLSPFAKWIIIGSSGENLAEKIEYLLKNPKTQRSILNQAYSWAVKQSWDKVLDIYLRLWGQA